MLLLASLLLAPSAIVAVSLAERRFGPAVAGRLNAAPLSIAIAILAVTTDRGSAAGAAVAEAAAAHVPSQVAFAAAFAATLARSEMRAADAPGAASAAARGVAALAFATVAFVAASLVVAAVPVPLAIAVAVPALVAGRRALAPRADAVPDWDGGVREIGVRAAIALAVVLAVLATVRAAGPGLGGAVAAYPALTATLATMIGRARGPRAAARLLGGVVEGLAGYLAFCVTVASAAPAFGVNAVPLALVACLAACAVTLPRAPARALGRA